MSAPIVEDVIEGVVQHVLDATATPRSLPAGLWTDFLELSDVVHAHYTIPATTITPIMRRLLYAIGRAAAPQHVVGVGTYVGYAFTWLVGDATRSVRLERAVGVDVSPVANSLARANCDVLGHGDRLAFVDGDGGDVITACRVPIDLLFLDLDDPETGKADYRRVLAAALPRLEPGSMVLAHDPCVPRFGADFAAYHRFLDECATVQRHWVLPVDQCGLTLAVVG